VVDGEADHAGEPASGPARRAAGPVGTAGPGLRRRPRVDLYVHLHQDAVEAGAGIGRVEGLGAATLAKIREWVGRADVRVTGVLDLDSHAAVDGHEVPDPRRLDLCDARTRPLPVALTPRPPLPRRPHRHHQPRHQLSHRPPR
ncbi:MAG TPA: hypothetical protein VFT75_10840, partial [Nocardioidaceae bacterium]|nr:hypothetical protein [Nocardioidaceae bacterium]